MEEEEDVAEVEEGEEEDDCTSGSQSIQSICQMEGFFYYGGFQNYVNLGQP